MARWKVTAKHYIHAEQYGQPTEWERQETNVDTGRMFRKTFKVPLYIDPDDRFCINQQEGFCVVARKGSEKPGDIVFFGAPTPDMEPLDAEAQAETDEIKHKWINPIEGLDPQIGQEFGKQLLEMLNKQLDQASAVSLKKVAPSEIDDLKTLILRQQEQINALTRNLAPQPKVEDPPEDDRPPVLDPLPPDADPEALPAPPPVRVNRPGGFRRV